MTGTELTGEPWLAFTEVIDQITRQPLTDIQSHVDGRVAQLSSSVGRLDLDLDQLRDDVRKLDQFVRQLDQYAHRREDADAERWIGVLDLVELRTQQLLRASAEARQEIATLAARGEAAPGPAQGGRVSQRAQLVALAVLTLLVGVSTIVNALH